jgi:high potential iron-sulfur protein
MRLPSFRLPKVDEAVDSARRGSLLALAAAPLLVLGRISRAKSEEAAVCFDLESMPASQKSMRRSLGFKAQALDVNKRCGTCTFFTAKAEECGSCALLNGGAVAAHSVCDSWAKKS